MNRIAIAGLTMLLAGMFCAPAASTPVPGFIEDWDTDPSLEGWSNAPSYGSSLATLSNPSEYLRIEFPARGGPGDPFEDIVYSSRTNYTGNYDNTKLFLRFRFLSEDALGSYSVLFHSSANDTEWEWAFANTGLNTWETFTVPFLFSAGWSGGVIGDQAEFRSALANIDNIGIYIAEDLGDFAAQDYGLDDWEYQIPEPATVCMLATTFLSLGVCFRTRIRGLFTHEESA